MKLFVCAVALALLAAPAAGAADVSGTSDRPGRTVEEPFAPAPDKARLTERIVVARFLDHPKVARWLDRYPPDPQTDATFDAATRRWTVKVWSGKAGEIALGKVEDADGRVTEAWTGPQVAWSMARGRVGSFGGKVLNAWWMWIPLSVVFFLGLVDVRPSALLAHGSTCSRSCPSASRSGSSTGARSSRARGSARSRSPT